MDTEVLGIYSQYFAPRYKKKSESEKLKKKKSESEMLPELPITMQWMMRSLVSVLNTLLVGRRRKNEIKMLRELPIIIDDEVPDICPQYFATVKDNKKVKVKLLKK